MCIIDKTLSEADRLGLYNCINIDTERLGAPFNGASVKPNSIATKVLIKY